MTITDRAWEPAEWSPEQEYDRLGQKLNSQSYFFAPETASYKHLTNIYDSKSYKRVEYSEAMIEDFLFQRVVVQVCQSERVVVQVCQSERGVTCAGVFGTL